MKKQDKLVASLRFLMGLIMKLEGFIMVLGSAVLVIATLIVVICRYWLYIATPWADELSRYAFLWIGFIGMGYVTQANAHIDVQLVDTLINKYSKNPEKALKNVIRLSQLISLVVLVLSSVIYGKFMFARYPAISTALKIPMQIPYMSTLAGLVLMSVHELALLFMPVHDPMGKEEA